MAGEKLPLLQFQRRPSIKSARSLAAQLLLLAGVENK
jgi:hypothetical protein